MTFYIKEIFKRHCLEEQSWTQQCNVQGVIKVMHQSMYIFLREIWDRHSVFFKQVIVPKIKIFLKQKELIRAKIYIQRTHW